MKGERYEVIVQSLANSGDGVGRIDGVVVFVPFSCPGDRLKVEITQFKKTFAKAKIIEILEPSKDRTKPLCRHFTQCGGCDWQHIQYSSQLDWKRTNLIESFKRIGKLDLEDKVHPTVASPNQYNYRNRIQVREASESYYYLKKGSQQPVFIKECVIADELINRELSKHSNLAAGRTRPKKDPKWELAITDDFKVERFPVNEVGQSSLGFRQVNSQQNKWLQQKINQWVSADQCQSIADLYCGQGNWALAIAEHSPDIQVIGIDENPVNIGFAKELAPKNCQFLLGDVDKVYPTLNQSFDLTIIDPPRAGCSKEFLEMLSQNPSKELAYISCDPGTLARDLRLLSDLGWTIDEVYPVDMFPQTAHLETLVFLSS